HKLPRPFFVLATQNPIEQEGTYPLPEAQLDRFMLKILVDYPSEDEELQIVRLTTTSAEHAIERVLDGQQVTALQELVRKVPCAEQVMRYALRLTRLTRPDSADAPRYVRDYIAWGAGPRASQYLVLAAKARALLSGRYHASTDDIAALAHPVLRHRIVTNFNAEADGIDSDEIVDRLLKAGPRAGRPGLAASGADKVFAGYRGLERTGPTEPERYDMQSTHDYRRYLDPRVLVRIAGLEMRARMIVEGFISGMHRSPLR